MLVTQSLYGAVGGRVGAGGWNECIVINGM